MSRYVPCWFSFPFSYLNFPRGLFITVGLCLLWVIMWPIAYQAKGSVSRGRTAEANSARLRSCHLVENLNSRPCARNCQEGGQQQSGWGCRSSQALAWLLCGLGRIHVAANLSSCSLPPLHRQVQTSISKMSTRDKITQLLPSTNCVSWIRPIFLFCSLL